MFSQFTLNDKIIHIPCFYAVNGDVFAAQT